MCVQIFVGHFITKFNKKFFNVRRRFTYRRTAKRRSFVIFFFFCERVNNDKFRIILIIKPTRCTNFSNLFWEQNSTCFWQFLCPSSGVFHWTHRNGVRHTGLLTACEQAVWHIPLLCVQWKTPDDWQRNCPKYVEFYCKNKFEKLVNLVGFIIRIYHYARSPERQIQNYCKFKIVILWHLIDKFTHTHTHSDIWMGKSVSISIRIVGGMITRG